MTGQRKEKLRVGVRREIATSLTRARKKIEAGSLQIKVRGSKAGGFMKYLQQGHVHAISHVCSHGVWREPR